MSNRDNEILRKAQEAFTHRLILNIWRPVVWVLGGMNILGGVVVLVGPARTKSGTVFNLLDAINVPDYAVGALLVLAGFMICFRVTATIGHFLSFLADAWWFFVILYIALFLNEPTSLLASTWPGALALIHLIAGSGRLTANRFEKRLARVAAHVEGESSE